MVLSLQQWKGQVAVVTGACSGIGAAIVKQLLNAEIKVVGLDKNPDNGNKLIEELEGKHGSFHILKTDTTVEDDVVSAFQWIKAKLGPVHIAINCAGVSRTTTLIDGDVQLWKDVLDTNILGVCIVTREALKDMRSNNIQGHIIHMNSQAGHVVVPFPNVNVYAASKFAITALTETLRKELNHIGSKIKVTSISPGLTATDMYRANAIASGLKEICQERQEMISKEPFLNAEDVADAVMYVLSTPLHVQIHELQIKPIGEHF